MRHLLTALLLVSISGCVIYDERLVYDDRPGEDPLPDDDVNPDEPAALTLSFAPGTASQGDVVLGSLRSANAPEDFDLRRIKGFQFEGPSALEVLTSAPRNKSEFQIVVQVKNSAAAGVNNLVVTMPDGSITRIEGAFEVVGDPIDDGDGCN